MADQLSINFRYLLDITDELCFEVAPDFLGTWQMRAQMALTGVTTLRQQHEALRQAVVQFVQEVKRYPQMASAAQWPPFVRLVQALDPPPLDVKKG